MSVPVFRFFPRSIRPHVTIVHVGLQQFKQMIQALLFLHLGLPFCTFIVLPLALCFFRKLPVVFGNDHFGDVMLADIFRMNTGVLLLFRVGLRMKVPLFQFFQSQ